MDNPIKDKKSLARAVIYAVFSVISACIVKTLKAELLLRNAYLLLFLLSSAVLMSINILGCFFKSEKYIKKIMTFIERTVCVLTVLLTAVILFTGKSENIDDTNYSDYINNVLSINDIENISEDDIVSINGKSYKTILTDNWYSYLNGLPYNKDTDIHGINVDYIAFKDNFVSNIIADKYYSQLYEIYDFECDDDICFFEENILNEKIIYFLKKYDNKIIFVKLYCTEKSVSDELIKKLTINEHF